jgi:hypothetical protein
MYNQHSWKGLRYYRLEACRRQLEDFQRRGIQIRHDSRKKKNVSLEVAFTWRLEKVQPKPPIQANVDQEVYIINPTSDKALTVKDGKVILWQFNGTGAQKWKLMNDLSIVNTYSGKSLDVNGGRFENWTNIQVWKNNGTDGQKWVGKDGSIVNIKSGKALDIARGIFKNGTNIILHSYDGTDAQKWCFHSVE